MRKAAALCATMLLIACGDGEPRQQAPASIEAGAQEDRMALECAIGGGEFTDDCSLEQSRGPEGLTLTLRDAEGGFRRLLVAPQGEIRAADGAEPAQVTQLGDGRAEVRISDDRYRLAVPSP